MKPMRCAILAAFAILSLAAYPGSSGALEIGLDTEFSGATPPQSPTTPWLTATAADVATDTVRITMAAPNLVGTEFVAEWYFNLDPQFNPVALLNSDFTYDFSDFNVDSISFGADAFKADGDGYFDLVVAFDTSAGGNRFTDGESGWVEFKLAGLTADSFDFYSSPGGGAGVFRSAAHVQGIGSDGSLSGWIGDSGETPPPPIPEPATMLLLGSGLVGLAGWGRKKFRR